MIHDFTMEQHRLPQFLMFNAQILRICYVLAACGKASKSIYYRIPTITYHIIAFNLFGHAEDVLFRFLNMAFESVECFSCLSAELALFLKFVDVCSFLYVSAFELHVVVASSAHQLVDHGAFPCLVAQSLRTSVVLTPGIAAEFR